MSTYPASYTDAEGTVPVTIHASEGRIMIYFSDGRPILIWVGSKARVTETPAGYVVTYDGMGGQLECNGAAGDHLRNFLSTKSANEPRRRISGSHIFFISMAVLTIAVCVAAYVWLIPLIASAAVKAFPVSAEIELGNQISAQYENMADHDSLSRFADDFYKSMSIPSNYPVTVHVIRSDEINAFAVPGGHIFIYTGLLKKIGSPAELQALIAHELTHVTERHTLRAILRQATSGIILSAFFGDTGALSGWVVSQADDLRQLGYSRELETEADTKGLQLMQSKGYDDSGMLRLLEILEKESAESPALMKYLSTHPELDERKAAVRAKLRASGGKYPVDPASAAAFAGLKRLSR